MIILCDTTVMGGGKQKNLINGNMELTMLTCENKWIITGSDGPFF